MRIRAHRKRLVVAMRRANPELGELSAVTEVETELEAIIAAFIERWIGPEKKPCA